MKNTLKKMIDKLKYNVVYALYIGIVLLSGEQLFRYIHPLLTFNLSLHNFFVYYGISFISILIANKKTIKGIYVFILLLTLFEYLHFNYYATWIFPLEYILFFTKFSETLETFITVLNITLIPLLLVILMSIVIYYLLRNLRDERVKIPYLSYILVICLIFIPARVFFKEKSKKGARPNIEVVSIVNGVKTMGYLFGKIIPQKIFGGSDLAKKTFATPPIQKSAPDVNVVVIMGESLAYSSMSLYGAKEKTTPYLDKLAKESNFVKKIAFSSGVVTDVALPSFFNILYEPDSIQQIISTNTCLFKMAKNNGFETYFYSAQSRVGLGYIKSYICLNSIDNYLDGTDETDELKNNSLDSVLVDRLENIDYSKSNFIVLHQIGSHSPYKLRYPKEFEKFGSSTNDKYNRNSYKNSILYTDYIIMKIIKKLKEKTTKPTYVFFTSDHGEGLGIHRGHGNLKLPSNYEVPYFLYTLNTANIFKDNENTYTSHYEIAKLVAKTLGYDISKMRKSKNKYVVCGKDLCGIDGYLELEVDDNIIQKQSIK